MGEIGHMDRGVKSNPLFFLVLGCVEDLTEGFVLLTDLQMWAALLA
jgi:hypothetical protein